MPEFDELTERLRDLGRQAVPPPAASQHLTAMTELARPRPSLAHKLRVGAAFAAGLLLGGSGLAAAGALPDEVQQVAHEALAEVNVKVPPGHAKAAQAHEKAKAKGANAGGGVARRVSPADCPDWDFSAGPPRNHGQYVRTMAKSLRGLPEAEHDAAMQRYAESTCGKPVQPAQEAGDPAP